MTQELKKTDDNGADRSVAGSVRTLVPAVDIQELADAYVVRLDIPGAEKESIAATVKENTLTVVANVPAYFKQDATLLLDSSLPGEYRREFALADNVDTASIDASHELGVLKIILKKEQQFLPKEIRIQ